MSYLRCKVYAILCDVIFIFECVKGSETLHCIFTGLIKCLAAFNDGRRIVSGSKDQSLKIWDLISLQCCVTLKGHTDLIWRVAVASDDGFIVSASKDDMLKVSTFYYFLSF